MYIRCMAYCCHSSPKLNKARLGDTIVNNEEAGLSVIFGGRGWGPLHSPPRITIPSLSDISIRIRWYGISSAHVSGSLSSITASAVVMTNMLQSFMLVWRGMFVGEVNNQLFIQATWPFLASSSSRYFLTTSNLSLLPS